MVDHDDAFNIVERWRVRRRQVLYACNDAPCRYDDLPHSYSEHVGGDDDRHDLRMGLARCTEARCHGKGLEPCGFTTVTSRL